MCQELQSVFLSLFKGRAIKGSSSAFWGLFCAFFLFAFFQSLLLWRSITSWIFENVNKICPSFCSDFCATGYCALYRAVETSGYSGACLWVPLYLILLKVFKTIFSYLYGNCHFSSNLPYSFMLGKESRLAQEERLILKLHALLYK